MIDDKTTSPLASPSASRWRAGVLALSTIGAGLAVRAWTGGAFAKYGGVALWSVVVFALVVVIAPTCTRPRTAAVALGISWLVELAQLTPVPSYLSSKHVVLRLVFGTTFNLPDLPAYLAGVGMALAIDRLLIRRRVPLSQNR